MFVDELIVKILKSQFNDYGVENYDAKRFGDREWPKKSLAGRIARLVAKYHIYRRNPDKCDFDDGLRLHAPYFAGLEKTYELLGNEQSRRLLVDLIAYRIMGRRHVKLDLNNKGYWALARRCNALLDENDYMQLDVNGWKLSKVRLQELGFDLTLYAISILAVFGMEHYAYQQGDVMIEAKKGDVVLDCGAYAGDTALYFATRIGSQGHVYSFEFQPKVIDFWQKNIGMNPAYESRATLVDRPVWDTSGVEVNFEDGDRPGNSVKLGDKGPGKVTVKTISIDDLVEERNISKVDFIKMDVEGAECRALKGAEQSIRRYRPKLAISVYHSIKDFVEIPAYIDALGMGYKMYLGHGTIHEDETVLFAI